jgi:hypothetical protein
MALQVNENDKKILAMSYPSKKKGRSNYQKLPACTVQAENIA